MVPVFLLALVLAATLLLLSNFVLPSFYRQASQTLQRDLLTLLVKELNQQRAYPLDDSLVLWADKAAFVPPPRVEGSPLQPTRMIQMEGVALGQIDPRTDRLRSDATAERAGLLLYQQTQPDRSWVSLRLRNVMFDNPARGELAYTDLYDPPPIRLPDPFDDAPQYLSYPALRELARHPERFDTVQREMENVVATLNTVKLRRMLSGLLRPRPTAKPVRLLGPLEREAYLIQAPAVQQVEGTLRLSRVGEVPVVVEFESRGRVRAAGRGGRGDAAGRAARRRRRADRAHGPRQREDV